MLKLFPQRIFSFLPDSLFSISQTWILPSKSPVAGWRSSSFDAPNVMHLKGCLLRSIVTANTFWFHWRFFPVQIENYTTPPPFSLVKFNNIPDCLSSSVSVIVYTVKIPCPFVWVPATTNLAEQGIHRQSNNVISEDFSDIVYIFVCVEQPIFNFNSIYLRW